MPSAYDLWYWAEIPGRGEFIRLALEAGRIEYRDCAREEGSKALVKDMATRKGERPFAPPYLVAGDICIAQTANVLLFLADRHGIGPTNADQRWLAHQLQLTIADVVVEAHNVHHPLSPGLYYEDQKTEALAAAKAFRTERIPKYLRYFETLLAERGPWLTGERWTYVDLSLFQLVEGLCYAFPRRMGRLAEEVPLTVELRDRVAALSDLASYFQSDRRIEFNEEGIFRHYPELDGD